MAFEDGVPDGGLALGEVLARYLHLAGTSPSLGTGRLRPLSAELVPGYTPALAEASARRLGAANIVQPLIGSNDFPDDFDIVTIT